MNKYYLVLITIIVFTMMACIDSEYEKQIKAGLKSNEANNHIIFSLELGDNRDTFYRKCEREHLKGTMTNEGKNGGVLSVFDSTQGFRSKVGVSYFPVFKDNLIANMPLEFEYTILPMFDKMLNQRNLMVDVKKWAQNEYPGNRFVLTKDSAWVKVDGNRQVLIFPTGEIGIKCVVENIWKNDKFINKYN